MPVGDCVVISCPRCNPPLTQYRLGAPAPHDMMIANDQQRTTQCFKNYQTGEETLLDLLPQ